MAEEDLDALAVAELLQEAKRGSERAKEMGAIGWRKCPIPQANKVFLNNTLLSIVSDSKRRQRQREAVIKSNILPSNKNRHTSNSSHHRSRHRSPASSSRKPEHLPRDSRKSPSSSPESNARNGSVDTTQSHRKRHSSQKSKHEVKHKKQKIHKKK
ncbi:Hypothetical predicted protein [Octopus vulgaris]|uniref:Protein POLR1D n=1 Tax=Octopus vulgaris TaxID=6645 RepID=A0AA36BDZ0_OCTVU|nr:Hypothetical predicted protein [Octopus vulgaris]